MMPLTRTSHAVLVFDISEIVARMFHTTPWPAWSQVCVFMPAWFGVASTIFLGLLTYQCVLDCKQRSLCSILWSEKAKSSSCRLSYQALRKLCEAQGRSMRQFAPPSSSQSSPPAAYIQDEDRGARCFRAFIYM